MEYCPGGDLHTLRQRQSGRHFSEYAVRICCETLFDSNVLRRGGIIGTGVSSHVVLGVIYWDIKLTRLPENVLVREDGHIMLSDFDLLLRCAVSPTLVRSSSHDPSKQNGAFCVQPACIETVVAGTKTVAGEAMKKPDETF